MRRILVCVRWLRASDVHRLYFFLTILKHHIPTPTASNRLCIFRLFAFRQAHIFHKRRHISDLALASNNTNLCLGLGKLPHSENAPRKPKTPLTNLTRLWILETRIQDSTTLLNSNPKSMRNSLGMQ